VAPINEEGETPVAALTLQPVSIDGLCVLSVGIGDKKEKTPRVFATSFLS
jgi:hypothetical protein